MTHLKAKRRSKIEQASEQQQPCARNLYESSGLPDNYVDVDTFMKQKKINVNVRTYSYWTSVVYSGIVIHQLSAVVIFVMIFVHLKLRTIDEKLVTLFYTVPILIAYLQQINLVKSIDWKKVQYDLMNLVTFVSFSYGLSPILRSLTETISSDTIYALSTLMLVLNLLFHDYGASNVAIVSKTFSFNSALFACVCLVSRFETGSYQTFTLVTVAFIMFALWPEYRKFLQAKYSPTILVWITVVSFSVCIFMLVTLKLWLFSAIYVSCFLVITFLCPYLLVKLQRYKTTIHGPWDEATIILLSKSD